MKSQIRYPVKVFATGFVVLTILSIPLFWFRFLCESTLLSRMPRDARYAFIEPSGLVPPELENDPNLFRHSHVSASNRYRREIFFLGIVDYFAAREPGGRHSNIYYYNKNDDDWTYFDERTGQIVCQLYIYEEGRTAEKTPYAKKVQKVQLYIGPEGISETADKSLGRFIAPIISDQWHYNPNTGESYWTSRWQTLYDQKLRRFFSIYFNKRTVVKGPQLTKDDDHKPVQIVYLGKNHQAILNLDWGPPNLKLSEEDIKKRGLTIAPNRPKPTPPPGGTPSWIIPIVRKSLEYTNTGNYLLVLGETGRIDLLDRETLEFAGTAGFLPRPQFSSIESAAAADLLGYHAFPLALTTDKKYRGMCVASISREGTALALAVYDEKGKRIKTSYTSLTKQINRRSQVIPSSRAALFEAPWAPASTIGKYLVENLQPPLLSIASFFTADSFEATSGHRALFILPNSFAAMKGREVSEHIGTSFYAALLIILPSIILAILLAWRVSKDATTVGLSENVKLYWLIGTIAFGLPAYITYRLTRPKITLVTCANCGNPRRPDMDMCHRCGSKWRVPELIPPAWRVVDS